MMLQGERARPRDSRQKAHIPVSMQYSILGKIGRGAYGNVFKAVHKSGHIVALKKIKDVYNRFGLGGDIINEIASLRRLEHPLIVPLLDVHMDLEQGVAWLAFEIQHGDLYMLYKNIPQGMAPDLAKSILSQLLQAVQYCHSNQVIHRDIKPQNILVDAHNNIKLTDFGMSIPIADKAPELSPVVVTRWYRAPELLMMDSNYSTAVDIWSIALVFMEIVVGRPIFEGKSDVQQLYLVFQWLGIPRTDDWPHFTKLREDMESHTNIQLPIYPQRPLSHIVPTMSEPARALCQRMLRMCPEKRVSASEALHDPFFA
eukprot:m.170115 g.170115  ORF g.170115 m.170115 type:complete len:314 (+) comp13198_c0_seq1:206-1147(+)